ncbi:MAG: ArsA family ATPase, partial [Bradymonadaceae bacterium]
MLDHFDDQRTIFVTGKGGVGKSTVTAALGRAFADRGERVLVAETATYSAMSSLLGTDLPSEEPAAVDPPLYGVELEASTCFVEALHDFLPSRKVIRTLVDNRVARVFFDAAPGINEFAILNQIDRYLEQGAEENPDWDRVIVDLPASGHAVTFLGVPETYVDLMKVGPIADRAGTLADRIRDPTRTALVAVALPEQMPVNETVELEQGLRNQLDRELTVVALNMLHRSPLDPDQREQFEQMVQAIDHDELVTDPLARPDDRQT